MMGSPAVAPFLASVFVCAALTEPAHATDSIDCAAADGGASIRLTLGSLPILAIVGAEIQIGDARWYLQPANAGTNAIDKAQGIGMIVGQAMRSDDAIMVDFTDPNVERVIASLRLFMSAEQDMFALAGTLAVTDQGAWAVICTGP